MKKGGPHFLLSWMKEQSSFFGKPLLGLQILSFLHLQSPFNIYLALSKVKELKKKVHKTLLIRY